MNLCNLEEELKTEVLVSSCPVPGDLLWFPAFPLWDVLCSSDTPKLDSSASFVQFLWAALFWGVPQGLHTLSCAGVTAY